MINMSQVQYFSYIMAVSFIGGGNQSTQRKPQICSLTCTLVVIGTDCIGSGISNYHMIMTTTAHHDITEILLKVAFKQHNTLPLLTCDII
jgi:hypothetical protein